MEGAMTTAQGEPYPFVTKVIDLFGDWLKQRRQLRELMQFDADPGELERIAHEFGVTPADLHMLVRQGALSADELPKMLEVLGIDEAAISRARPALLRDMERVCSFCTHKRQCSRELAAGTAPSNYVEYCGNADAIDELRLKS
jgi:transcriptional regulator with XRE-family HTH domain